jgi:hypothetical protein
VSDRTVILSGFALRSLRLPHEVVVTDTDGALVAICPDGAVSEATDEPLIRVSATDLDEIEREPEGLLVLKVPFGAEDSSYVLRTAVAR